MSLSLCPYCIERYQTHYEMISGYDLFEPRKCDICDIKRFCAMAQLRPIPLTLPPTFPPQPWNELKPTYTPQEIEEMRQDRQLLQTLDWLLMHDRDNCIAKLKQAHSLIDNFSSSVQSKLRLALES